MLSIWSTIYLENDVDSYNCYINENLWKKVTNEYNTSRIFARINNGDKYWICSLGQPIKTNIISEYPPLFVPSWMLGEIDCIGDGSFLEVEFMPSEAFDHSESIILQPERNETFDYNIQEQLSIEFTKLGVLQKNTNICVNISGIDHYFKVKELTPASVVLCEGDEVKLDFVYESPIERAPSPYPFHALPQLIEPMNTELSAPVSSIQRFNPWRNKDFKPNVS